LTSRARFGTSRQARPIGAIAPPDYMHGRALLGPHRGGPADYLYGLRDRMDERYDFVRGVRDARYLYVRNCAPYPIYGQFVCYMFQTPTTRVWRDLYEAGRLSPAQRAFWETKPPEELYDFRADPDEVRNLVGDAQHSSTLRRLRRALRHHLIAIRDLGFLPEPELHARTGDVAPYDFGRDDGRYPLVLIFEVAELATWPDIPALPQLTAALQVLVARASLDDNDLFTSMLALNALDYLDRRAMSAVETIAALPREQLGMQRQFDIYVPQLLGKILADLEP